VRRAVDGVISTLLLLLCSPVLLGAALAIWLSDFGPVFFQQERAGLHNRSFRMFKFRSMRINNLPVGDATEASEIRSSHPLVTPVGRWIRRFKIDELPQLLNVLRGEMSLIGPRPTVPEQTAHYNSFELRRLDVPPGMTGWAQVNGGIELSWPERIMLDVWYVEHCSLWLDLRILARTIGVVLFGERAGTRELDEAIEFALGQSESASRKADASALCPELPPRKCGNA
jgi:lipopolysaccharide/colanic/teichoic acid biosynthesis glycosyltransferase